MPADLMPRITAGLEGREMRDAGSTLDPLLLKKSPVALALIRGACGMLEKSVATLRQSFKSGATARRLSPPKPLPMIWRAGRSHPDQPSKGGTPTAIDIPKAARSIPCSPISRCGTRPIGPTAR